MDEEETVAAPASRIRFAPLARDKVGWRGFMGWRTICWPSPAFKGIRVSGVKNAEQM